MPVLSGYHSGSDLVVVMGGLNRSTGAEIPVTRGYVALPYVESSAFGTWFCPRTATYRTRAIVRRGDLDTGDVLLQLNIYAGGNGEQLGFVTQDSETVSFTYDSKLFYVVEISASLSAGQLVTFDLYRSAALDTFTDPVIVYGFVIEEQ